MVATAGNTLGAMINWGLGRYAATWRTLSLDDAKYERACLPVVGDLLTLLAGTLRTPFLPFLLLVLAGKAARYAAVFVARKLTEPRCAILYSD